MKNDRENSERLMGAHFKAFNVPWKVLLGCSIQKQRNHLLRVLDSMRINSRERTLGSGRAGLELR